MMTLLYVLHFMVCFVLIGVVLLQRGKGSDIGAALGGGGANTVFGSRGAGNFLSRLTTACAIIFMCTSLSLAYFCTESANVELFNPGDLEAAEQADPVPAATDEAAAGDATSDLEEIDLENGRLDTEALQRGKPWA